MIEFATRVGDRLWRRARAYGEESRGASVVEFALVTPVLLVVLLMGFELAQALSVYRKLTDTTAELASIVSQQQSLTKSAAQAIMTDATEIMRPYSISPLTVTMLEVTTQTSCTTGSCTATIDWEQTQTGGVAGGTDTVIGNSWTLPTNLQVENTSYILIETTYNYTTTVGAHYLAMNLPVSAQEYISPRQVGEIPCADC